MKIVKGKNGTDMFGSGEYKEYKCNKCGVKGVWQTDVFQ